MVFHRSRTICDTCSWGTKTAATDTVSYEAYQPIVVDGSGGLYTLWSGIPLDAPTSQTDVYYSKWVGGAAGWEIQGNLSSTSGASNYAQALQRSHPSGGSSQTRLEVIWTDGDGTPYHIADNNCVVGTGSGGGGQSAGILASARKSFALGHPHPNPFARSTGIRYQIQYSSRTSVRVYDTAGRLVKTVVDGWEKPGMHVVDWSGDDDSGRLQANGVYFIRLCSGDFRATRKAILLR